MIVLLMQIYLKLNFLITKKIVEYLIENSRTHESVGYATVISERCQQQLQQLIWMVA